MKDPTSYHTTSMPYYNEIEIKEYNFMVGYNTYNKKQAWREIDSVHQGLRTHFCITTIPNIQTALHLQRCWK
ncbi:hypothetical protein L2E82_05035 [Cichorium intybus]|uniref:Uncharacterized protein n=2 Tax=Cichorium intybus TaxID=13427 RepID=A0ACB8Z0C2_CICIN|nr:hypothetical protein L2E82_49394 [Cichorium intybus]KAI3791301.1 hypothetical protein L2E82_05035 [Cichorium intybus]